MVKVENAKVALRSLCDPNLMQFQQVFLELWHILPKTDTQVLMDSAKFTPLPQCILTFEISTALHRSYSPSIGLKKLEFRRKANHSNLFQADHSTPRYSLPLSFTTFSGSDSEMYLCNGRLTILMFALCLHRSGGG